MNRRDFIKNSLLLCGCSCLAGGAKLWYDNSPEGTILESKIDGINLNKEYLIEKYKNKSELPKKVRIDACTICQLNCVRCFMRLNPDKVKKGCGYGYLSFKNYKKFVDDNDIEEIQLNCFGEMFLNPELLDIIKYSDKKGIKMIDTTGVNLNYLTEEMAEALVKYNFQGLVLSIDGATPETYAIYRRGGDFNTVINNIKKINYFKKKYNSKYPILTYKFILFGHNEHEIDKAKKLAKKLNMDIKFELNYDSTYSPVKNVELVKEKTGLDSSMFFNEYMVKRYKNNNWEWYFCKQLWNNPQINWDGKLLGCCWNYFGDLGGNVFKDGYLKAMNHPKMIYAKNMLAKSTKPIPGIPCTECCRFTDLKKFNLKVEPKIRFPQIII